MLANLFQDFYLFGSVVIAKLIVKRELKRGSRKPAEGDAKKQSLHKRYKEKLVERSRRSRESEEP